MLGRSAIIMDLILIVDPKDVVRDDGRHIAIFKKPNFKDEVRGILSVLVDPKIILFLPAMFCGEINLALVSSINGKSAARTPNEKVLIFN